MKYPTKTTVIEDLFIVFIKSRIGWTTPLKQGKQIHLGIVKCIHQMAQINTH